MYQNDICSLLSMLLPQKLHGIINEWAKIKIVSGTSADWNKARELLKIDDSIADVNLWIDSSDFSLQKTKDTKTWWNHKLTGIGIRVQFIIDATER
eukprot:gene16963-19392_t